MCFFSSYMKILPAALKNSQNFACGVKNFEFTHFFFSLFSNSCLILIKIWRQNFWRTFLALDLNEVSSGILQIWQPYLRQQ
jgi:hypothetical protein